MREINKNMDLGKVQKSELKSNDSEKMDLQPITSEGKEIKDFSNPTAEALGRSQVNKTDNLKSDVAFASAYPQAISKSDKLFNMALAKLEADGDPNAYEKACSIATSEDAKELFSR